MRRGLGVIKFSESIARRFPLLQIPVYVIFRHRRRNKLVKTKDFKIGEITLSGITESEVLYCPSLKLSPLHNGTLSSQTN